MTGAGGTKIGVIGSISAGWKLTGGTGATGTPGEPMENTRRRITPAYASRLTLSLFCERELKSCPRNFSRLKLHVCIDSL